MVREALFSTETLSPERVAAMYRDLAMAPYRKRQGELALQLSEPCA